MVSTSLSTLQHGAPICSYYTTTTLRAKMGETFTSISISNQRQDSKIQDPRAIIDRHQLQEKLQISLNGLSKYKMHFTLAYPRLPPARTTSFAVLVSFIVVICARSIVRASYVRVFGSSMLKTVSKQEAKCHMFKSGHWRSALRDLRELDDLDSESTVDSTSPEEEKISVEELSHAYKKLDKDYKKFLSECGLGK